MEDSSFEYPSDILYTQEPLSGYKFGGYHPVRIGDTFKDNRYTIHHKLTWGGFSTVWLAHDNLCVTNALSCPILHDSSLIAEIGDTDGSP